MSQTLETFHLKFFADMIESELGIQYSDANFFQLEHRLKDIAAQLQLDGPIDLYRKAQLGLDTRTKDLVLDLATNNETSFFRDIGIFKSLESKIIPDLAALYPTRNPIRIWSTASSTGQEICSILMSFELAQLSNSSLPECQIYATDFSERVLTKAKAAVYTPLEVQRGLNTSHLSRFFDELPDHNWKLKDRLRTKVIFKQQNLLHSWGSIGPFEIVFCRNVLIYQSVENKSAIIDRIANLLVDQGVLILGAAESMIGLSDRFDQIQAESGSYYRKRS